jgi:hypothetical protein
MNADSHVGRRAVHRFRSNYPRDTLSEELGEHVAASRTNGATSCVRIASAGSTPRELDREECSLLEPLDDEPLVIGRRGLADLLGDLAVATDDLSS